MPEITGPLLSMFTLTVAGALKFPALSTQVPIAVWPVPELVNVIGVLQKSIPERLSVPVHDTVTLVLFQPLALGTGITWGVATGGVWSILMVTETELCNPAPLVAEQVKVTPGVSAVSVVLPQPVEDVTPDSGSVTVQLTVTLLRYHPLFPSVPEICGTITGGVVSSEAGPKLAVTVSAALMITVVEGLVGSISGPDQLMNE